MEEYLLLVNPGKKQEALYDALEGALRAKRVHFQDYSVVSDRGIPILFGHGTMEEVNLLRTLKKLKKPFVEFNHNWYGFPEYRDKIYRATWCDLNLRYSPDQSVALDRAQSVWKYLKESESHPIERVLICPPTEESACFYGDSHNEWLESVLKALKESNHTFSESPKVRLRHSPTDLQSDLDQCDCVIGYNTVVLNQALAQGKRVVGASVHPVSGLIRKSYQNLSELPHITLDEKKHYFAVLASNQGTVEEYAEVGFFHQMMEKQRRPLPAH